MPNRRVRRVRPRTGALEEFSREELIARVLELEAYIRRHNELVMQQTIQLAEYQVAEIRARGGRTR